MTFAERDDAVGDAGARGRTQEAGKGLIHGFAAQAEGVVVHRNHEPGVEIKETLQRFFGAGVDRAVAVGKVSPDGQKRNVGLEAAADLGEAVEVGSVSGVVESGCAGGLKDVAAESAMGIAEDAGAPVPGGG